jgi:hypothetical protein
MRHDRPMLGSRAVGDIEADLAALRAAAERAGTALGCLFSSSAEFEAAVISARRSQGAFRAQRGTSSLLFSLARTAALSFAFLML